MRLIDIPILKNDELIVNEEAGTFTIELKGSILGSDQDLKLQFGVKNILSLLLVGITNPILKWTLTILINLFA
jgi:hypothetical protein